MIALGAVLVVSAVTLGSALRDQRAGRRAGHARTRAGQPARAVAAAAAAQAGLPQGPVILYVPIDRAPGSAAIVYHRMEGSGTFDLTPSGKLLNAGIVDRIERQIIGPTATRRTTSSPPARPPASLRERPVTQVYSPVNGTIVGITPMILNGAAWGSQLSIQPQADPGVVVVVSHLFVDPALRIGQQVTASQEPTLLGTVADLSKVLKMELARYTADAGNHAHIELRPTPVLAIP